MNLDGKQLAWGMQDSGLETLSPAVEGLWSFLGRVPSKWYSRSAGTLPNHRETGRGRHKQVSA